MKNETTHITRYSHYLSVLVALLLLTTTSVLAISFHLGSLTVALALLIATIKGALVMTFFMHLKSEYLLLRLLVIGVVLFYISIVLVTFIDYSYR
jgi:cytochrome c oxidase subunit IV